MFENIPAMRPAFSVISAIIFAAVLLAAPGCGDDSSGGSIDASSNDATSADASGPDASTANICATLCDCASTFCSQDRTACLDECTQLPASVRACRNTHCGYAQVAGGAVTHCPHVSGDPTNRGTPPACIFDLDIDAGAASTYAATDSGSDR